MDQLHFIPPIWQRIRVKGDCTLRKLHRFIQVALGWNRHDVHELEKSRNHYTPLGAEVTGMLGNALDDHHFKLRRSEWALGLIRNDCMLKFPRILEVFDEHRSKPNQEVGQG